MNVDQLNYCTITMIIAIIGPMNDHTVPDVVGNQQLKKAQEIIYGTEGLMLLEYNANINYQTCTS